MRFIVAVVVALVSVLAVGEDWPRRIDVTKMQRLYQTGTGLVNLNTFNPSPSHKFGQPNAHFPWLHPGGVDGDNHKDDRFSRTIMIDLPSRISVYKASASLPEKYEAPNRLWRWSYPKGTRFEMVLSDRDGVEFSKHVSVKVGDGNDIDQWEGEEVSTGKHPVWYTSPSDCRQCHADIPKHARILLPDAGQYYHWPSGSDGRFNWHPFKSVKGVQGNCELRDDDDSFIVVDPN